MMSCKINDDNVELTFTAPKSVSVATVNHDERSESLLEAHQNAIASVLEKIKKNYAPFNLISECVHMHTLTDEEDLHSHILVGLNSKLHRLKSKEIGKEYRKCLADNLREKGFDIETKDEDNALWELKS